MRTANREQPFSHKLCCFMSSLCAVQHLQSVFFNIWLGMV